MRPEHLAALNRWLTATFACLLIASSYLLDGPSDIDAARATSADKQDATKTAAKDASETRAAAVFASKFSQTAQVQP